MNIQQKMKTKFRTSSKWKAFRKQIASKQNNLDVITQKPLRKGFNCHHKDLDEAHYQLLIESNFVCLNKQTHEFIHWLFNYYNKDETILYRIKIILDEMKEVNRR